MKCSLFIFLQDNRQYCISAADLQSSHQKTTVNLFTYRLRIPCLVSCWNCCSWRYSAAEHRAPLRCQREPMSHDLRISPVDGRGNQCLPPCCRSSASAARVRALAALLSGGQSERQKWLLSEPQKGPYPWGGRPKAQCRQEDPSSQRQA